MMMATIKPKRPIASAKMRIRIIPTKSLGWIAFMRTPTSPTTPMAKPEAYRMINKILKKKVPSLKNHSRYQRPNACNPRR
jgi:hypothetical protein